MKLYAVRHGETAWNAENRICGITDLSLTARGLSQAEELAAALSTVVPAGTDTSIPSIFKLTIFTSAIVFPSLNLWKLL